MTEIPLDENRGPVTIGVLTALTAIALFCVLARLYTRFRLLKAPGWDDLVLVLTMIVLIIPNLVFVGIQISYGIGRHEHYLSPSQISSAIKWNFISNPFGIMVTAVPKIAVVIFLGNLVGKAHRREVIGLHILVAINIVISIVDTFMLFFQCNPPSAPWKLDPTAKCWDINILLDFTYFVGAYSAFIDLVLALYPASFVWKLKIKTSQKVFASCIMGLGLLACACAVVRTTTLTSLAHPSDSTWGAAYRIIWVGVESNMIVICASVPAFWPLVQQVMKTKDYRSAPLQDQNRTLVNQTESSKTANKSSIRSAMSERSHLKNSDDELLKYEVRLGYQ